MSCAFRMLRRLPQRLVIGAERRAAVAGDEAGRVVAGLRVAHLLQHRQPHERLDAAHEGAAAGQGVAVVEGDRLEALRCEFGDRCVHGDVSRVSLVSVATVRPGAAQVLAQ